MGAKKLNPIELEKIRQSITPKSEAPELYVPEVISTSAINKKKLLEMAARRDERPRSNSKDHEIKKLVMLLNNYTSASSGSFDREFTKKIKEMRPDWFINSADLKKEELLKMATSGDKRPLDSSKDSDSQVLVNALRGYTITSSSSFDREFTNKIKTLRPDWFVTQFEIANTKKQELLEMAARGDKRPRDSSKDLETKRLGVLLCNYTIASSGSFDREFTRKIKGVRPDWFVSQRDEVNLKKEELLKMATDGGLRPSYSSKDSKIKKLGASLCGYISASSGSFDREFTKKIKEMRPDWFINSADLKKEELLKMAARGDKKPSRTSSDPENKRFQKLLGSYNNKSSNSFDPEFTCKIKKLRPDWFIAGSENANSKKEDLFQMAARGDERPSARARDPEIKKVGIALTNYTSRIHSSFDLEFTKKIKTLRPDWFKKKNGK